MKSFVLINWINVVYSMELYQIRHFAAVAETDAAGLPGPNPSEPRSRNIATAPIICNRAEGQTPARKVVQCCSKHSRLLLPERALETALGFVPKRHRQGQLPPARL